MGAHLGPTGPRWAPCCPHEYCYLGLYLYQCVLLSSCHPPLVARQALKGSCNRNITKGKRCRLMEIVDFWSKSLICATWMDYTHWGRVTHKCVGKLSIIGSDNGFSPGGRQAIIWTNSGILLIEPLVTNFSEILIETHIFSFKKIHLKMLSEKWRPFCLGLNVLIDSLL